MVCFLLDLAAGLEQMPPQRALAYAQAAGDLLLRNLLHMEKDECFPLQLVQVDDPLPYPGGQRGLLLPFSQGFGEVLGGGCVVIQGKNGLSPQGFESHIAGHLPQKVLWLADAAARMLLPRGGKELQPGLLGQILRLVRSAGFAVSPAEKGWGKFLHKGVEGMPGRHLLCMGNCQKLLPV